MIKQRLMLCSLATFTLFAQANSDHLHEALKQVNKKETTERNSKTIEHLLKQCRRNTQEKKQQNRSYLKYGTGQIIAGFVAILIASSKDNSTNDKVINGIATFMGFFTLINGTKNLGSLAISHFMHNKEYTNEIEAIEKALATIKAKKENKALSQ